MALEQDPWELINEVSEGSEGTVEARVVLPLLSALGWRQEAVQAKLPVAVQLGRGSKQGIADFVISDPQDEDLGFIVVEAKRPGESLALAVEQAESYAHYLRAPYLLVTDGQECHLWRRNAYVKPQPLLQTQVSELSSHRAEWSSFLSPEAIRQWQALERESISLLPALDHAAAQAQSMATRKRTLVAQFLREKGGTTAERWISEWLELQSPWRDRFDEAQAVDEYMACFRGWPFPAAALDRLIAQLVELEMPAMMKSLFRRIESLERPALPHAMTFTLEGGDAAFGEENVVLQQTSIPMMVPWTESLDSIFQADQHDQSNQFASWLTTTDPTHDSLVEQVIKPAMRGEYAAALNVLERTPVPTDWSVERCLARKRLMGALYRLHGDSGRAENQYREAERLARSDLSGNLWVKRRLMLDLNAFLELGSFQALGEKHEEMLGILAWYSNPVVDAALGDMTQQVLKEAYEQQLDRPTTSRSSSYIFEGWRAYLKALFFAFASGDLYTVKMVHRQWAWTMLMLPHPHLRSILPPLWTIDDHDLLQKVIRAQPRESYAAWEERWDTHLLQRSPNLEGLDAQNRQRTVLHLIPLLAPYLADDTVRRLQEELVAGLVGLHRREREEPRGRRRAFPMIQGENFSSSYALEALVALAAELPLCSEHLTDLIRAVAGMPFSHFNAWRVLAAHDWLPEELSLAEELIEASVPLTDRLELNAWADFLRTLSLAYPTARGIQTLLIETVTDLENGGEYGLMASQRWFCLLCARWPGAISFVQEHAPPFFADQAEQLLHTTGQESYTIGIDHVIRSLPLLLEHYPEALTGRASLQILLSLVAASNNERLPLRYKKNVLATLEFCWPLLTFTQRKRLRRAFLKQSGSDTLAVAILRESPGPGYAPDTRPLQFHRLRLDILMDSPGLHEDWALLLDTLTDAQQFHRQEALDTLGFLLERERFPHADLYAMLLPLAGDRTRAGAYALYLCIKFPPRPTDRWHSIVINRMQKCIHEDDMQAIHAALSAIEQLLADHDFRRPCLEALAGLRTHVNRAVRTRVAHLSDGGEQLSPDATDPSGTSKL